MNNSKKMGLWHELSYAGDLIDRQAATFSRPESGYLLTECIIQMLEPRLLLSGVQEFESWDMEQIADSTLWHDCIIEQDVPLLTGSDGKIVGAPPVGDRPYDAGINDTSEYMIGDVHVTVVLLESRGDTNQGDEPSTEDWTNGQRDNVRDEIEDGLEWWETMFDNQSSTSDLRFQIDWTYLNSPYETTCEPINHSGDYRSFWIDEWLNDQTLQPGASSVRSFVDQQRQDDNTDWAFTIFVVNSENDFATDSDDNKGRFTDGLFAFAPSVGAPYFVMTYNNANWGIGNMDIVTAHETGHIFYALDEYYRESETASWQSFSGYYHIQNENALYQRPDGEPPVEDSIMGGADANEDACQQDAFSNHSNSHFTLEMIGWRDSDVDGIFDVLDEPLTLDSPDGWFDDATGTYRFTATSAVNALPNLNHRSAGNDITLNEVDRVEYCLNGGQWITAETYGTFDAAIDIAIPIPQSGQYVIEIRTVADDSGATQEPDDIFSDSFYYLKANTVDVVQVIDRSGSMGGSKIAAAKDAAKLFTDLMNFGDKIGVVSYSSSATTNLALTTISDQSIKDQARSIIDTISASGMTSIGAGVLAADQQLSGFPNDAHRAMIVMTDGQHNTSPHPLDVINSYVDDDIVIYTIGFGSDADASLLAQIAGARNGQYYYAPSEEELRQIFFAIGGTVKGRQQILNAAGVIRQNDQIIRDVVVEQAANEAVFGVDWSGSDIDLVLISPDGSVVNHDVAAADPDITVEIGSTYEIYTINDPQIGQWQLRVLGSDIPAGGEPYRAYATVVSPVVVNLDTGKSNFTTGELVQIQTTISDGLPILGAVASATVAAPSGAGFVTAEIKLYDDGLHGDGAADDGIYGNQFRRLAWTGNYTISVDVEGVSSIGSPFVRHTFRSIVAAQGADSDGDNIPDTWENREGTNPGVNDANLHADGDGLTNYEEYLLGTKPLIEDTDTDSYSDGAEYSAGTDPLDMDIYPSGLLDLTSSVAFTYGRSGYDRRSGGYSTQISIQHTGITSMEDSCQLVVTGINDASITLINSDGLTSEGQPFINLEPWVSGDQFDPGETIDSLDLQFSNPNGLRLAVTLEVHAEIAASQAVYANEFTLVGSTQAITASQLEQAVVSSDVSVTQSVTEHKDGVDMSDGEVSSMRAAQYYALAQETRRMRHRSADRFGVRDQILRLDNLEDDEQQLTRLF